MENKQIVLSVKDLKVNFSTDHGYVQAVRGVSFDLYKGETLCIVGESGSGKSVTNKAIMGILSKNGRVVQGSIMYEGEDLTKISEDEFHRIRGHKIGMIFQDPLSSLNPIVRIGKQITEGMLINASRTKRMYDELVADSLTAYRNAQTELKTGLAKGTENIKFLKSEKKKHIALAKNEVSNEVGGRIYTAKQNCGAAIFELKSQEHYAIAELKEESYRRIASLPTETKSEDITNFKTLLSEADFKKKEQINDIKAVYLKRKAEKTTELKDADDESKPRIKAELADLQEKYCTDVNDVKAKFIDTKISLLEKYLPREAEKYKLEYEVSKVKAATDVKVRELNLVFGKEKIEIKKEKSELALKSKENVAKITEKYDSLIAQAKKEYNETKSALIAEYKPKIAAAKQKFEADSVVAKEKVAKYKAELQEKYVKKVVGIKGDAAITREKYYIELEKAKKDYLEAYNAAKNSSNSKSAIEKVKKDHFEKIAPIQTKIIALNRKEIADIALARDEYISSIRITRAEAKAKALEVMAEVGIKDPEKRFKQYPFEFSGGMRQRIVIAIALTANPDILICDEPTTALDVTIQAQILELINKLKKERNLSCIFITHDLGVVANMADRVAVMYAGKIVEYGTEEEIFYDPKHPYTWALLSSIPDVNSNEKLDAIPGTPPNMIYPPVGDAFALRSKYAMEIDFKKEPPYFKVSDTHYAATWLLDPRAPKVEMPKIVKQRIENSLKAHKKGGVQ